MSKLETSPLDHAMGPSCGCVTKANIQELRTAPRKYQYPNLKLGVE